MIAYITGASSGLGAYTAQALADAGWTVVAGARSFKAETDGRMIRLPLDVTRDDSVRDFIGTREANRRAGCGHSLRGGAVLRLVRRNGGGGLCPA